MALIAVFLRLLKKKKKKHTHIYIYIYIHTSQRIKEDASILCDSEFRA